MLDTSAAEKFGAISLLNTWMWLAMRTVLCRKYTEIIKNSTKIKCSYSLFYSRVDQEWPRQNFSLQHWYNIKQTRDRNKEKIIYLWGDYWLIQYQILQTNIIIVKWQMVRRITNEIIVKVLKESSFFKVSLLPKCSRGESSSLWWKATIHSNNLYSVTRLRGNKTKLKHWKLTLLQTILKNLD